VLDIKTASLKCHNFSVKLVNLRAKNYVVFTLIFYAFEKQLVATSKNSGSQPYFSSVISP
jgi:hypothetical protein